MEQAAYPPHVVEAEQRELRRQWNEQRVLRMAGFPRRLVVGLKTLLKSDTSLKSVPHVFAVALKPRLTKAEAMELMRARYGV